MVALSDKCPIFYSAISPHSCSAKHASELIRRVVPDAALCRGERSTQCSRRFNLSAWVGKHSNSSTLLVCLATHREWLLRHPMTMLTERLTGQALLDYVNANPSMTHTQRCTGAGYLKELKDGSHGCSFTEFFEALLKAKNGPSQKGSDWLEGLTDQDRSLYEMIEDRCPEFTKLDATQCRAFMDELSEHGITTAEQFENSYFYQTDSWKPEAEFCQFYAEEIACLDVTNDAGMGSFLVIDWQATWDCNLRHDFFNFGFDGVTYFFHSNF